MSYWLRNSYKRIRDLHLHRHHLLTLDLNELARFQFLAFQLRDVCHAVVNDCLRRQENAIPKRTSGPVRHLSVEQRRKLASSLGLTPVKPHFSDADDLNPTKFKPTIENRMSTRYNCVCCCLSYILTGRLAGGGKLQQLIIAGRTGNNYHLFSLPGHSRDIDFASNTDLRILARLFKVNIYMWWPADDLRPARWLCFTGNHQGPNAPAFHLAQKEERGLAHCVAVTRLQN